MTTAAYNETNPFAIRVAAARGIVSYIPAHRPKSFDWKYCGAKAHPMKQAPDHVFIQAGDALHKIIDIG